MKKTIRDYDLKNKKVIIRVDFNVPLIDGEIMDDNRIKQSLKTIEYAINNEAKVILMSHLGRIKNEEDKKNNSLKKVGERLSKLLNQKVVFINQTRGSVLEKAINDLKESEVLLMENTRFEDLNDKAESSNNKELGKYWSSLGDIYINDAFGTCHREHASNVGIASNLPNGIGFLVEKELKTLNSAINCPEKPLCVILGGSKVNDKIPVIKNLVKKANYLLIAGGMAYTFLKASGFEIGNSLLDREHLDFCQDIMKKYPDKIILPIDSITAKEINNNVEVKEKFINEFEIDDIGLDIGYQTIKLFKQYLEMAKTIIWNGPVGYFEIESFSKGTKNLCEILKNSSATTIIGGGDTASAVINFGYKNDISHISTGGGASLELLEGKNLPGIDAIGDKNE